MLIFLHWVTPVLACLAEGPCAIFRGALVLLDVA
ncbi:unnamed protein product [Ectocarpus sp. CCAP 1310/34]|nr:unnamed protein product [Ectocarpus sp. CCAP 1310/34]